MYLPSFLSVLSGLAASVIRGRKIEANRAYGVLEKFEKAFDGRFDEETKKKIAVSHSIYNPLIMDSFSRLKGRATNDAEKERLVSYFTCSSLLDNFFDRGELTLPEIYAINFDTERFQPKDFDQRVYLHCHQLLLKYVPDKASYLQVLRAEVDAQAASLRQFDPSIPNEEIRDIMMAKGGNAVLLCRHYLDDHHTTIEDACWYQLGAMIQMTNDLYDVFKDARDGIATLATRCTNASELSGFVEKQIETLRRLIAALPYPEKSKQRFYVAMAGVASLAMVATDNLKRIEKKYGHMPEFRTLPRKELIIDNEKAANILRCLWYVYRLGRKPGV